MPASTMQPAGFSKKSSASPLLIGSVSNPIQGALGQKLDAATCPRGFLGMHFAQR